MTFRPYVHQVNPVRTSSYAAQASSNDVTGQPIARRSILFPISQVVDLSTIPAAGVQDYFLWTPFENTLEIAWVGADQERDLGQDMRFQLVQKNGNLVTELTTQLTLRKLFVDPDDLPRASSILDGPVFLRVTGSAVSVDALVTLHILTSEVR